MANRRLMEAADAPVRVLLSTPTPRPTTNPYITMLTEALAATPGIELSTFDWRTALTGDYDVFHVHWPEVLLAGRDPVRRTAHRAAAAALLARLHARSIPVVRTLHNLRPHDSVHPVVARMLEAFDRRTAAAIRLNPTTPSLPGVPTFTILHGHYEAWYSRYPAAAPEPGRIASFGLIRRYKNLEGLVHAFSGLEIPDATLRIAGPPADPDLAASLTTMASADPRIRVTPQFLDDPALVQLVTEAELVVLPYAQMHNSGAALAALSLHRPILVPVSPATDALAEEVGPHWVRRFTGPLSTQTLREAMRAVAGLARGAEVPDLSARSWATAGKAHLGVYRAVLGTNQTR